MTVPGGSGRGTGGTAAARVLARALPRGPRGERPDWRERDYRLLVLRHDRIGDMILATGVLRAIAEAYPRLRLDVLASRRNAPVLRGVPWVHELAVFDPDAPLDYVAVLPRLRAGRYDAVVDAVGGPRPSSVLAMLAAGARYRIGITDDRTGRAYTLAVPPRQTQEHLVDRLGALVTAFGLQPTALDLRPELVLSAAERERGERAWRGDTDHGPVTGPRVLINVAAGRERQRWPEQGFVAVARAVRARDASTHVVVIAAPSERGRAALIAAESGTRFVEDGGLRDAFAITAGADVVFTPDSSIAHACSALRKPAAVLYGRGEAAAYGPYRTGGRAVESRTAALTDISSDEAARAVLRLLNERDSVPLG